MVKTASLKGCELGLVLKAMLSSSYSHIFSASPISMCMCMLTMDVYWQLLHKPKETNKLTKPLVTENSLGYTTKEINPVLDCKSVQSF